MSRKKELFDLIKSLNKNEKRYFRMFTSFQTGHKKYLLLFDAIDSHKIYDEQKIKDSIKDRRLVKHFAFNKNYLKMLIIKCMVLYNHNNISDIKIQNMITAAKILFKKALYSQYFKILDSAKKLAIKNERFGYLLEILDMEKYIIKKDELHYKKSSEIYETVFSSLEKIRNYFKYSSITSSLIYNYRSTGIGREVKHETDLKRALNKGIMSYPEKALSTRSLENYYRIKEIANISRGNFPEVYNAVKKRYEIINKNPRVFKDHIIDFKLDSLLGMTDVCIKLNKLDEAEEYLQNVMQMKTPYHSDSDDIAVMSLFYRFQIYLKKKEIKPLSSVIHDIENLLNKYDNKLLIDTELYIKFCLVKAYLLLKKYDKALDTINHLLVHKLINKREDLKFYLLLLNLIIHFELKNYDLLNHLIRSSYRFLVKNKRLYKTENIVLKYIQRLRNVKSENEKKEHISKFIKQLSSIKAQPYEQHAFEYFDFLEWAKSIK